MKKLLILSLIVLASCSKKDDGPSAPTEFREIYQGTFWLDDTQESILTFTPDALIHFGTIDNSLCADIPEGTFNDVNYFGCVFSSIVNVVEVENETELTWRQVISAATGTDCPPDSSESTISVEALNDTALELKYIVDGVVVDNIVFTKSNTVSFELTNCETFYFLGL